MEVNSGQGLTPNLEIHFSLDMRTAALYQILVLVLVLVSNVSRFLPLGWPEPVINQQVGYTIQ